MTPKGSKQGCSVYLWDLNETLNPVILGPLWDIFDEPEAQQEQTWEESRWPEKRVPRFPLGFRV